MDAALQTRKVGWLLGLGIVFFPYIFCWFLLKKGYSTLARVLGFGWAAIIFMAVFGSESHNETQTSQVQTGVQKAVTTNQTQTSISAPEATNSKDVDKYAGKIDPSALYPYTAKGGFEKTVKKYGSRLKEITTFRRQAAERAVDSGKCDSVIASELSDKSTLKHLNFWVDCNNGERIYLDEFQLKKGGQAVTQRELAISKGDAMVACEKGIKSNAQFPSSVDIHHFSGTAYYEAPTTHNVVLEMDFDAKNGLGNELPYKAICNFPVGEEGTIEIKPR